MLRGQSAEDRHGAARDLVYQALEQLSANATTQNVTRAIRFLRASLDQYPSFGDAHYFRYLCLKRLNQEPNLQKNELEAAERYNSEALRDRRDPFVLAVPKIYDNLVAIGQKWALVVGISRFQPRIGAMPLDYAASDATAFADLLKDSNVGRFPANQVFILTDKDATTANIKARLNRISTYAKPEDVVVVYIATHGSSRDEDLRKLTYLLTYDTNVTSKDDMFGSALGMVDVSEIIRTRCVAQRTVVFMDTCHSGAGVPITQEEINLLRQGAGRYVISSCGENESAWEESGHGVFTASLINHLRARRGCMRLNDLYGQVEKDVSDTVKRRKNADQHPQIHKSDSAAEIVLGAAPGGASDGCLA
jgi:hypothetical protein